MPTNNNAAAEFSACYLQRLTRELSEDLDKIRNADDFKSDSVSFLVHALKQGVTQFPTATQERVVDAMQSVGTTNGRSTG
jgi:ribosome assembly protein 3